MRKWGKWGESCQFGGRVPVGWVEPVVIVLIHREVEDDFKGRGRGGGEEEGGGEAAAEGYEIEERGVPYRL